jgi:hypothetical protein
MAIARIFRQACRRALRTPRLTLLLYCFNLLLAFPVAHAFHATLQKEFGRSLAPERLLPGFDFTVFADFLNLHGGAVDAVLRTVVPLALLGMIVGPFLTGGVIAAVRAQEAPVSVRKFFRDGGYHYGRMFRLFLLFGLVTVLLLAGGITLLGGIVSAVDDDAVSEVSSIVAALFGTGIICLLLAVVFAAAEFTRIAVVASDSRRMVRAAVTGIGFAFRNIGAIAGLFLLFVVAAAVLIAAYWWFEGMFTAESGPTIAFLFLLQQLFVVLRIVLRIALIAGENLVYEARKPEPVLFYGWDDSPVPAPSAIGR